MMAGIPNPMLWGVGIDPLDEFGKIERSVRLRPAATAQLTRVFGAPTNNKKWTVNIWLKRSDFGAVMGLLNTYINNSNYFRFSFNSGDAVLFQSQQGGSPVWFVSGTGTLFRDAGSHVNIHFVFDSENAVAAMRNLLYSNGDTVSLPSSVPLSHAPYFNYDGLTHNIGRDIASAGNHYLGGYISQFCVVDGQALPPSAFGQFHSRTGQWRPKSKAAIRSAVAAGGGPRNGWGANGCLLPFDDTTSLTTLGYDRSQSDTDTTGNNWTATNISLTPGNTNDSMLDTPTDVFCTWNTLVPGDSAKSNGNLDAAGPARGTMDASAIPCQWEITANAASVVGGVVSEAGTASTIAIPNGSTYGFRLSGGVLEYTTNGSSWASIATGLTGVRVPYASGGSNTLNCGQRPTAYALTPGFRRLSTKNLPQNGIVTLSGSFAGNVSADGPAVFMNGSPETLTINGNPVTFGTHADRLSNGFKLRTASSSYNASGTNTWTATILSPSIKSLFRYQNARGNP